MFRIGVDAHDDTVSAEVIVVGQILTAGQADAHRDGILHLFRVKRIGIFRSIIGIQIIVCCLNRQHHFSVHVIEIRFQCLELFFCEDIPQIIEQAAVGIFLERIEIRDHAVKLICCHIYHQLLGRSDGDLVHAAFHDTNRSIKGDIAQRGMIEDGTAIGMGLANAISRLKDSKAKSKVIILLTDGSNNRGDISPLTAAEIAKQFGIRVYTIGVGTNGTAPYPMQTYAGVQYVNVPVEIDEQTLTQIAGTTNGNYFRATSNSKLEEVYREIDKLEKTKLNVKEFSKREEAYATFALIAFFCILLEILLRNTVLKKIP